MKDEQARSLVAWLSDTAATLDYGEVMLKLIVHDRQVRRILRSVMASEQPTTESLEDRDSTHKKT